MIFCFQTFFEVVTPDLFSDFWFAILQLVCCHSSRPEPESQINTMSCPGFSTSLVPSQGPLAKEPPGE